MLTAIAGNTATPIPGYRKKGFYYYKTRHAEKVVNVNGNHLNKLFADELRRYEYEKSSVTD